MECDWRQFLFIFYFPILPVHGSEHVIYLSPLLLLHLLLFCILLYSLFFARPHQPTFTHAPNLGKRPRREFGTITSDPHHLYLYQRGICIFYMPFPFLSSAQNQKSPELIREGGSLAILLILFSITRHDLMNKQSKWVAGQRISGGVLTGKGKLHTDGCGEIKS